ncbi:4Fe-4S dicluster domain-containing protein [Desulfitobacterium sp. AusDCA]|uniref:4Fe-4S dicluster domain-containing protein n=1 Tax=Desulfitobacterium sp. AusDCA TaxID=3240383 RepID=UPI003DA6D5C6
MPSQIVYYNNLAISHGKAGDCISCGKCEQACPQHLPIREYLKNVAEKFEKHSIIPTGK